MTAYPEVMPPVVLRHQTLDENFTSVSGPSVDHLRDLAWAFYLSGTVLQTFKGSVAKLGLGSKAVTAIKLSIDLYTDAINALIAPKPAPPADTPPEGFLTIYIAAIQTKSWPPVTIPMPPVIDPNATLLKNVLADIKGAVNTAIIAFQGAGKDGEEVANGLSSLESALDAMVGTIQQYYPNSLK